MSIMLLLLLLLPYPFLLDLVVLRFACLRATCSSVLIEIISGTASIVLVIVLHIDLDHT